MVFSVRKLCEGNSLRLGPKIASGALGLKHPAHPPFSLIVGCAPYFRQRGADHGKFVA